MTKIFITISIFSIFSIFLVAQNNDADKHLFFWNLQKGQRIESVKTADVEYYENGLLKKIYQERNIIDLTAYAIAPNGGFRVTGVFKLFVKTKDEDTFKLNEEYKTDFIINTNGRYIVQGQYLMPNSRHIPTFLEEPIGKGGTWSSDTEQLVEVSSNKRITLASAADYVFSDIEIDNENNTNALIQYHTIVDKDLAQAGIKGLEYPSRIYGFNYGSYIWDMQNNIPVSQSERYQILFGFGREHNFASIGYKMNINSTFKIYDTVSKNEEEEKKERIIKDLEDEGSVDVKSVPQGIAISLGEILFDTDSANIKPDARNTIESVLKAIENHYPDREIIVEGHTDNTGDEKYNQGLSERRAKSVANFINPKIKHDKLSYKGYGSAKPATNNNSPDGKKKNRRVEIIIKLR